MGIFSKKTIALTSDKELMNFWCWFNNYQQSIVDMFGSKDNMIVEKVLNDVDNSLLKVFPLTKKNLQFEFGYNKNTGMRQLFIFHLGENYIKMNAEKLAEVKPNDLKWDVIVTK